MKLDEIKQLVQNKLTALENKKEQARMAGEIELFMSFDDEIAETKKTLLVINNGL